MAANSDWGIANATLTDPSAATTSNWGITHVSLTDPEAASNSEWGFVAARLRNPHYPIGVRTATGTQYVPIKTWDGTEKR